MARLVRPSQTALATELEVQRAVWKRSGASPFDGGYTDEERDVLCAILNAVSDAVEHLLGGVIVRDYDEWYDGGGEWIVLRHRPVIAVQEVREHDQLLAVDVDFAVERKLGRLRRLSANGKRGQWPVGSRTVRVRYRAGWATQQRDASGELVAVQYEPGGEGIRQGVLLWCQALWETGPAAYSVQIAEASLVLNRNVGIPPQVQALLQPYRPLAYGTAP